MQYARKKISDRQEPIIHIDAAKWKLKNVLVFFHASFEKKLMDYNSTVKM